MFGGANEPKSRRRWRAVSGADAGAVERGSTIGGRGHDEADVAGAVGQADHGGEEENTRTKKSSSRWRP
jgi:outer membrane lipoprotein SlyB